MLVVSKNLIDRFTDYYGFIHDRDASIRTDLSDDWDETLFSCCDAYRRCQQHNDFLKTLDLSSYRKTTADGAFNVPYFVGVRIKDRDKSRSDLINHWGNLCDFCFVDKDNRVEELLDSTKVAALIKPTWTSPTYSVRTGDVCCLTMGAILARSSITTGGSLVLSRAQIKDSTIDVKGKCVIAGAYLDNVHIAADCDVYILGGSFVDTKIDTRTPLVFYETDFGRFNEYDVANRNYGRVLINKCEFDVGHDCDVELFTNILGINRSVLKLADGSSTLCNGRHLCAVVSNHGMLTFMCTKPGSSRTSYENKQTHIDVSEDAKLRLKLMDSGYIRRIQADQCSCCSLNIKDRIDTVWIRKNKAATINSQPGRTRNRKVLVV